MDESVFHERVDDLLLAIEDAVEDSGADIDYETAGGILTLRFADGSQIIVNRQTPVRQVWVATRSGGFHFDYDEWRSARRRPRPASSGCTASAPTATTSPPSSPSCSCRRISPCASCCPMPRNGR